jgi:hypothetical protein
VLHSLRAWYAHAEPTIRLLDRGVAVKAHDLIVEGAIISTQLARKFGISLPDVSKTNWDLTPKTTGPGGPVQVEM